MFHRIKIITLKSEFVLFSCAYTIWILSIIESTSNWYQSFKVLGRIRAKSRATIVPSSLHISLQKLIGFSQKQYLYIGMGISELLTFNLIAIAAQLGPDLHALFGKVLKLRTDLGVLPFPTGCSRALHIAIFELKRCDILAIQDPNIWTDVGFASIKTNAISVLAPQLSYSKIWDLYWAEERLFHSLYKQTRLVQEEEESHDIGAPSHDDNNSESSMDKTNTTPTTSDFDDGVTQENADVESPTLTHFLDHPPTSMLLATAKFVPAAFGHMQPIQLSLWSLWWRWIYEHLVDTTNVVLQPHAFLRLIWMVAWLLLNLWTSSFFRGGE